MSLRKQRGVPGSLFFFVFKRREYRVYYNHKHTKSPAWNRWHCRPAWTGAGDELMLWTETRAGCVRLPNRHGNAESADIRRNGRTIEFEIEKEEDEDIGLLFDNDLMDTCRSCTNRCVFCFIDQLPRGMRPSLYFKDDDLRMSFLDGNYVTLTNLSDAEFHRLVGYRLSPMNISVHALDPGVRSAMMNNRFAGNIMERLRYIADRPISLNIQIVLVPGINDGAVLEETVTGLSTLGDRLSSISVVPVGLTRYRAENRLPALRPYGRMEAAAVIEAAHSWQRLFLAERGTRLVYPSDEFYLRAGRELPAADSYEDFPQLENGVGMVSLFRQEMEDGLAQRRTSPAWETWIRELTERTPVSVHPVSGADFGPLLDRFADEIRATYGVRWTTHALRNSFFGETVTVAGLLTGADIAAQTAPGLQSDPDGVLLVPATMLRADGDMFLDDWTPERLGNELGVKVAVCGADAPGLLAWLDQATGWRIPENG